MSQKAAAAPATFPDSPQSFYMAGMLLSFIYNIYIIYFLCISLIFLFYLKDISNSIHSFVFSFYRNKRFSGIICLVMSRNFRYFADKKTMANYNLETETTVHVKGMAFGESSANGGGVVENPHNLYVGFYADDVPETFNFNPDSLYMFDNVGPAGGKTIAYVNDKDIRTAVVGVKSASGDANLFNTASCSGDRFLQLFIKTKGVGEVTSFVLLEELPNSYPHFLSAKVQLANPMKAPIAQSYDGEGVQRFFLTYRFSKL